MCLRDRQFKHARHGFSWPAGCPWAWWWHAWHGWRTGWCPQKVPPSKPHWPPGVPWQQSSGSAGRSWSPVQFLSPDAGRVISWWVVQCSSGISWSHGEPQFQACTCVVSSLPLLQGHSFWLPWWPAASWEPFPLCSFLQFALYVPFYLKSNALTIPTQRYILVERQVTWRPSLKFTDWSSLDPLFSPKSTATLGRQFLCVLTWDYYQIVKEMGLVEY